MVKIKVGYLFNSYPYKRNIIDKVDDVEYVKVFNFNQYVTLLFKILNKLKMVKDQHKYYYGFSYRDFRMNHVDLFHFFNSVSFSNKPWIATFETRIPRYSSMPDRNDHQWLRGIKAIAGDSCKKVIAISDCTKRLQLDLLRQFPEFETRIKEKICVVQPPQKLLVDKYDLKKLDSREISFIFVGREFFRKGGMEVLRSFIDVKKKYNLPLKLTIISSMIIHDYATHSGKNDLKQAEQLIIENKSWIKFYKSLPNDQVLELMAGHHVGLLPTWADTYGYSVLEMQASGCPVITTNVRALPEINDNKKGWIIDVPKDYLGEALYSTKEQRHLLSSSIEEGLKRFTIDIFQNPNQLKTKAEASISSIRTNHDPGAYADKLKRIYQSSLGYEC